jgi:hypothetical protein
MAPVKTIVCFGDSNTRRLETSPRDRRRMDRPRRGTTDRRLTARPAIPQPTRTAGDRLIPGWSFGYRHPGPYQGRAPVGTLSAPSPIAAS